ncbi:MAG: DNA/RNA non-specific endonuclease [Lactobacillales bacterium]|jgi:DNA-entry nuclease|nr:DNA/RNA non-specific endonuclease [Lactobacillales bacterium]
MKKKIFGKLAVVALFLSLLSGCRLLEETETTSSTSATASSNLPQPTKAPVPQILPRKVSDTSPYLKLEWDGTLKNILVDVNQNNPTFTEAELTQDAAKGSWVTFSALDDRGRVGTADALLCESVLKAIGEMKRPAIPAKNPTAWKTNGKSNNRQVKVDGKATWLYNRSHIIGWQLAGDAGTKENIMTGTRPFNSPGMLYYEMTIANYLETHPTMHVRYRVIPDFRGDELLVRGVGLMAESVEDKGATLAFNGYVFNDTPGVTFNYENGTSMGQGK